MKDKTVIFDTNVYRNLTFGKDFDSCIKSIEEIKQLEKSKHIDAYMTPVVLLELFAHMANINDPSYINCKNAAAISYLHSKVEIGSEYRLLADSESLLAKAMFNYEIPGIKEKWNYLGGYAYNIYKNPDEKHIDSFRANFQPLANFVDIVENTFITDFFRYVVLGTNPSATDWSGIKNDDQIRKDFLKLLNSQQSLYDLAKAQVFKACTIANIDPTTINDIDNRAAEILRIFPAPIYLYREIMKRIAMSGCDLSNAKRKRWNWIWDIQILFSCANSTINNKEVLLITSDGDMLDSAKSAGLVDKIKSLDEYLAELVK